MARKLKRRLVVLPAKTDRPHFQIDILQLLMFIVILILTITGVFPWWAVLLQVLASIKGITVKFATEWR